MCSHCNVSVAPTSDKVIVCVTGTLRALGQSATRQMPGYEDTSLTLSLRDQMPGYKDTSLTLSLSDQLLTRVTVCLVSSLLDTGSHYCIADSGAGY